MGVVYYVCLLVAAGCLPLICMAVGCKGHCRCGLRCLLFHATIANSPCAPALPKPTASEGKHRSEEAARKAGHRADEAVDRGRHRAEEAADKAKHRWAAAGWGSGGGVGWEEV